MPSHDLVNTILLLMRLLLLQAGAYAPTLQPSDLDIFSLLVSARELSLDMNTNLLSNAGGEQEESGS